MTHVMKKTIRVPLRYVILVAIVIAIIIGVLLFYWLDNAKLYSLVGGLVGGLVVYLISFMISMYEFQSIDRFRELGVKELLPNRRERAYYHNLLQAAEEVVDVAGSSCSRFIDDFCNENNDDHVLVDSLSKHNKLLVRILVPSKEFMDPGSSAKFDSGENKLRRFIHRFPTQVDVRRFDFQPKYSLVRVDEEVIVGPIFLGIESKDSPAIHLEVGSAYARKYMDDFDRVWNCAKAY